MLPPAQTKVDEEQHDRARHVEVEDLLHDAHHRLERRRRDQLRHHQEAGDRDERSRPEVRHRGISYATYTTTQSRMSDDSHALRISRRPAHRRHLRHDRGRAAAASRTGDPDWCNLGQGQPETGAAARRAAARRSTSPSPSTIRSTRRSPASGSCARRSPALYNRLYRRGMPSQYTRRERLRLRRRARRAHARGGQPRAHQPRATSCPTTPRTKSCSTSSRRSPPSRSCSRASAATRFTADDLRREMHGPRPVGAAAVEPVQPDRQARRRATSSRAGCALARELDCALLIDEFYSHYIWTGRPGAAAGRERRALRRGRRTAIRSCSSTGSPRTGATRAGA